MSAADSQSRRTAKEHAALQQARDLQRAKAIEDHQRTMALVKSKGYRTPDEFNAAKAEEFRLKGKPPAEFTAAPYRDGER